MTGKKSREKKCFVQLSVSVHHVCRGCVMKAAHQQFSSSPSSVSMMLWIVVTLEKTTVLIKIEAYLLSQTDKMDS